MRHALADAPETDDAERHVAGTSQRPGGQVVPPSRLDIAMVSHDVAHQRQREGEGMGRDFADTVVRRIGDPNALVHARLGIDGVVSRPDPADDGKAWKRSQRMLPDGRVLQQDADTVPRGNDDLILGPALRDDQLDAGVGEKALLELGIGKIVICTEDPRHGRLSLTRKEAKRTRRSLIWSTSPIIAWLALETSLGACRAPRGKKRHADVTADYHCREPSQARMACPSQSPLGALVTGGRYFGRGQTRRRAPRAARSGTRRHRYRHRWRTDPASLRDHVHRGSRGGGLPA